MIMKRAGPVLVGVLAGGCIVAALFAATKTEPEYPKKFVWPDEFSYEKCDIYASQYGSVKDVYYWVALDSCRYGYDTRSSK